MFVCLFLEIPLFYCLKKIKSNRKSKETIGFCIFLRTLKKYHHLLTKFGVISMTTAYFMDDSIFFEIYWKYIGFADFNVPTDIFERILF